MERGISCSVGGVEGGVDIVGCGGGRAVERKRGEWGGRRGEGEERFEEEGVGGAGGEHELERGISAGVVGREGGLKRGERTASAPCLFFHGIQRGKRVASSVATA